MDQLEVAPQVRPHDRQSMRYVNEQAEREMEIEDQMEFAEKRKQAFTVINLGKIGGPPTKQENEEAKAKELEEEKKSESPDKKPEST